MSPSNLMELELQRGRAEWMAERGRDGGKEDSIWRSLHVLKSSILVLEYHSWTGPTLPSPDGDPWWTLVDAFWKRNQLLFSKLHNWVDKYSFFRRVWRSPDDIRMNPINLQQGLTTRPVQPGNSGQRGSSTFSLLSLELLPSRFDLIFLLISVPAWILPRIPRCLRAPGPSTRGSQRITSKAANGKHNHLV